MTINSSRTLVAALSLSLFTGCVNDKKIADDEGTTAQEHNTAEEKPLFRLIPSSESGIEFTNKLTETPQLNIITYHYFYNGGGVACGDLNNDGLPDLYFTANQLPDKLYLNKGNMKFEDISNALPPHKQNSWNTGVTMADVNADGLLDIYVCRSGNLNPENRKNVLLINKGNLQFEDQAEQYGLADEAYSTQAAFFDYDRDGDLDMYLLNHEIDDITNYNRDIRKSTDPHVGDKLYKNEGGKFVDVSKEAGIHSSPYGFGLGVAIGDLNNDGWPDIYVTNDFLENDFMYFNNGDGSFTEKISTATGHISNYGMGVDIADFNNDGLQDVLVVDMVAKDNYRQKTNMSGMNPERFWNSINFGFHYQYMYNSLQLNQGGEKFSEVGQMAGVSNTDWSWSALMADLDKDGAKDIFITNGLGKDVRNNDFVKKHLLHAEQLPQYAGMSQEERTVAQLSKMPSQPVANYIYQNKGRLRFADKSKEWGIGQATFSTGAAYADLDNDGDLDLVVNNIDEKAFVYANTDDGDKNHLSIQLKGSVKNPFGIDAKITVKTDKGEQVQEVYSTRGFQSSVPPLGYFGLGNSTEINAVEVLWPDGKLSTINNPEPNQTLVVDYASAKINTDQTKSPQPLLADITEKHGINFRHQENQYDDFAVQVLLPHKLSTQGPALAVADVNDDGLEDFVIGGAAGFSATLFMQGQNGTFAKTSVAAFAKHKASEDIEAVFFDADGDTDMDLYITSGGYEFEVGAEELQDRLYLNDGKGNFSYAESALPAMPTSTASVKPYDFDGDGDLDLFVGGRLVPGRWPNTPKSYLLRNNGGRFTDVTKTMAPDLQKPGMVTDAAWIDVDNDSRADLVITGEWMPIVVYKNTGAKLAPMENNGLDKTNGWWYSLKQIDFDNDGDLDLVGGNLGLNYKYQASEENPFKVFASDFDNNQTMDVVLSYSQEGTYFPVRGRECSSQQLPHLKEKFPDYNSFAVADVYEVLEPENIDEANTHNAYTFATTLFENVEGKFVAKPLNPRVQLSSINDIAVEDLNGDGNPDLVMAGNMYGSEVETPRNDAGYGNILLGTGSSQFKPVPATQTGFFGEGDVKQLEAITIGNQTAFLVASNNGELRLFGWE